MNGWNDPDSLAKRLRARARNTMIPHSIFDEAADELDRLRELLGEIGAVCRNLTPAERKRDCDRWFGAIEAKIHRALSK